MDFDHSTIERDARRYGLRVPPMAWDCLMVAYAGWYGEWSDYFGSFKWQPLPGGTHDAVGDALAALELLHGMAAPLAGDRSEVGEDEHLDDQEEGQG